VDSQADSAEFVRKQGATFPVLSDPDMKVITAYGVAMKGRDIAVPSTFIIDRHKNIRWRYVGETQADRPDNPTLLEQTRALK